MDTIKIINPYLASNKFTIIFYILMIAAAYPLESIVIPKLFSGFFSKLNNEINNDVIFDFIKYFQ